jgi:hypothetical protein
MKVWVLIESDVGWSTDIDRMLGIFSSPQAALQWLRKSRRFMNDPGGPLIPMASGCLNERFCLREETIDPEPWTGFGDRVTAMAAGEEADRGEGD